MDMKKRHSQEQIIKLLREAERASSVSEFCRQQGISEQTFYRWRRQYGNLTVSDARRLRELDSENRRLKKLVAEQALALDAMQDVLKKRS